RLSIIDLEGSKQPLRNEDGTVWVVFNGEIYNYLELRIALSGRGHALREAGDTEVLVHLWEEYGSRMLEHLRGMFAFAIYDTRSDTLFMARDRFGQKPLYYWQNEDFLAFASELQAFWALDDFPGTELNNTSVCRYFRYGYVPGPRTIYKTVKSLPPGHSLTIRNSAWKTEQYWRPRVEGCDDGCIQDRLEELLDEATRIRLRSDVPLGAFLSGGVDSALVVASMTRQMQTPVETFTITSDKAGFDESGHARRTSNHLGTMHHEFQVDPDLVAVSEGLARHFGQPFADYSCVPTYYVSRETRKHVTVALSGDGGDELFAGYQRYKHYRWSRLAGRIPWRTRRLLAGILWKWGNSRSFPGGGVGDFLLSAGGVDVKGENHSASYHHFWREQCFQPGFYNHMIETEDDDIAQFKRLYNEAASDDPLEKWLEVDQRMYLAEDILTKVDISSMAVSLECRSPFLDHLLAEAANRIPARTKLRFGRTKIPLRNLAAKRLPKDIGKLPKKGFSLPLGIWFRYDLKDWAYETLFGHQSAWEAFMRPQSVRWLWQEHQSSRNDHSMRLWIIISWILWWNAMREGTRK
ncbi:MAG: asparagine synthase (glutamine-hydrolyzing), partial [Desulfatiglans sp.]|nr:asparagine synthase (glutamine-hydrolyzing) [Desulfatiglans sp.]